MKQWSRNIFLNPKIFVNKDLDKHYREGRKMIAMCDGKYVKKNSIILL